MKLANGPAATVGGGLDNFASHDYATIAGGRTNTANGIGSAIPGGQGNVANGQFSFAAGLDANAENDGSFVWGDDQSVPVTSPANNSFSVRASGGIWLGTNSSPSITSGHFIDTSTGAYLTSTGTWTNNSDRAKKYDLSPLDARSVLDKVARMPITSWSYKGDPAFVRHVGPMAQDFYAAFGLGLDNKHITTIDEGGVALAAVQGLYRQNRALEHKNRTLSGRLARLERAVARLEH
jgi:hypothetical protein